MKMQHFFPIKDHFQGYYNITPIVMNEGDGEFHNLYQLGLWKLTHLRETSELEDTVNKQHT